jgi:hypothetical protein
MSPSQRAPIWSGSMAGPPGSVKSFAVRQLGYSCSAGPERVSHDFDVAPLRVVDDYGPIDRIRLASAIVNSQLVWRPTVARRLRATPSDRRRSRADPAEG